MMFWSTCLWDKGCGFPVDFNKVSDLSFQQKAFKTFLSWPVTHFSNTFKPTVPSPHAYSITLIWQILWQFYVETLAYRWIIDPRWSLIFSYERRLFSIMFRMWSTEKSVPSVSWGMACLLACLQILFKWLGTRPERHNALFANSNSKNCLDLRNISLSMNPLKYPSLHASCFPFTEA